MGVLMTVEMRPFSYEPRTGIRKTFHYDHADDTFTIETVQDVDSSVELNKAMYNNTDERARWKGGAIDEVLVARIPLVILYDLKKRGILDDQERFRAWLNDNENRFFKTRPGRI